MQALTENISRIQGKLQEVLKRYQAALKDIEQQQKLIASLKEQREADEKKIKAMEEQQHILKMGAGSMTDKDKKEFEQVIGKYIREIDKCIGLLSE